MMTLSDVERRERKNEASKRWKAANPEKVREQSRRWYQANRQHKREADLKRYWADPEAARARRRQWREDNPEAARAHVRRHHESQRALLASIKLSRGCEEPSCPMPAGYGWIAEQLDFDHVRGDKVDHVSKMATSRGALALWREAAKCDVVCANCHRLRTEQRRSE